MLSPWATPIGGAGGTSSGRAAWRACTAHRVGPEHGRHLRAQLPAAGAAAAGAAAPAARCGRCLPQAHGRRGRGVRAAASQQPQQPSQQRRRQRQQQQQAGDGPAAGGSQVASVVATPSGDVRLGSFLSRRPSVLAALEEAVGAIRAAVAESAGGSASGEGFRPELALVFATAAYGDALEEVVPALRQLVPSLRHVFGCTSFGAVGSARGAPGDVEGAAGISLTLASLPGVEISITHTLRSGIPDEDASPEAWYSLVGLAPAEAGASGSSSSGAGEPQQQQQQPQPEQPQQAQQQQQQQQQQQPQEGAPATSFLMLADPKFQQTRPLLAGLDFAFPNATKVGGVISSGQRYKRRAMYAWSADGPVRAGSRRRPRLAQQRQQQRLQGGGPGAGLDPAAAAQQQPRREAEGGGGGGGFFGSLFSRIRSGFGDEARPGAGGPGGSGSGAAAARALASPGGGSREFDADEEDEDDEGWARGSGMHMYGAAVLALRGGVYFDPITSQGYRAVGDKSWVVGRVSRDGGAIFSLIDPSAPEDDEDGGEVPPLMALLDLLEAGGVGGRGGEITESELEDLGDDKVWVAIAPDALSADKDIGPDDYQMMKLTDYDESYGAICVDGQVRTGYRLKLVLRDPEGTRADLAAKLLRLKRDDLAAVLAGEPRAPALGALLFLDLERGGALHGEAGYEARQVGAFLPVPLAGMYAAAEVSTVNRKAALYELATVAAVLRVAPPARPDAAAAGAEQGGEQAPQA